MNHYCESSDSRSLHKDTSDNPFMKAVTNNRLCEHKSNLIFLSNSVIFTDLLQILYFHFFCVSRSISILVLILVHRSLLCISGAVITSSQTCSQMSIQLIVLHSTLKSLHVKQNLNFCRNFYRYLHSTDNYLLRSELPIPPSTNFTQELARISLNYMKTFSHLLMIDKPNLNTVSYCQKSYVN